MWSLWHCEEEKRLCEQRNVIGCGSPCVGAEKTLEVGRAEERNRLKGVLVFVLRRRWRWEFGIGLEGIIETDCYSSLCPSRWRDQQEQRQEGENECDQLR